MTTLEKILQEIEDKAVLGKKKENGFVIMKYVRDIFEKYLSCENSAETDRQSRDDSEMIGIDDDRLWNILFEEACVEGEQAKRIYNRLKEICSESYKQLVESSDSKCMREREEFLRVVSKYESTEIR